MSDALFTEVKDPAARREKLTESAAVELARLKSDLAAMGPAGLPLNNSVNMVTAMVRAIADTNEQTKGG